MNNHFLNKPVNSLILFIFSFAVFAETGFEPNNIFDQAKPILVNDFEQQHKFDFEGDEDWIVFYAKKGIPYDIKIGNVGSGIDPVLELYNENGELEVSFINNGFTGEDETQSLSSLPANGFYTIRVFNLETTFSNENSNYSINIFEALAPQNGLVKGKVIDQCTQGGIKAELSTEVPEVLSHRSGVFGMVLDPGTYNITASSRGYIKQSKTARVEEVTITPLQFALMPEKGCSTSAEQLKQDSTAIYDDISRVMTIKHIRVDNTNYTVSLTAREDFSFVLTTVTPIDDGFSSKPAFYNFDSLVADIPQVFAFGRLFAVQLKLNTADGSFFILKADPFPQQ